MAITYTTIINQLYTVSQPDPNYVVNVVFTVYGTDGTYSANTTGNIQFDSNQSSSFIPYNQLTEEIVIGWINEATDNQISYYENVDSQINALKNPPIIPQPQPLPWITPNPIPADGEIK